MTTTTTIPILVEIEHSHHAAPERLRGVVAAVAEYGTIRDALEAGVGDYLGELVDELREDIPDVVTIDFSVRVPEPGDELRSLRVRWVDEEVWSFVPATAHVVVVDPGGAPGHLSTTTWCASVWDCRQEGGDHPPHLPYRVEVSLVVNVDVEHSMFTAYGPTLADAKTWAERILYLVGARRLGALVSMGGAQ